MKVIKHRDGSISVKLSDQEAHDLTMQVALTQIPWHGNDAIPSHQRARWEDGPISAVFNAIHDAWGTPSSKVNLAG